MITEIEKYGVKLKVSEEGLVWSCRGRLLAANLNMAGYPRVTIKLPVTRKPKHLFVHHLVAEAFIGPRPEGAQVNHKDLNRQNPRAENLEYLTVAQNILHGMAARKRSIPVGRGHARSTVSKDDFDRALELKGSMTTRAAAAITGISKSHIQYIWSGKVNR